MQDHSCCAFRITPQICYNIGQSRFHGENGEIRSVAHLDFIELIVRAIRPVLKSGGREAFAATRRQQA
jgi:hypothetical protein